MKSKAWKVVGIFCSVILGGMLLIYALTMVFSFSRGARNYSNSTSKSSSSSDAYSSAFQGGMSSSGFGGLGQYAAEEASDAIYEAEKVITRNRINIETKNIAKSVTKIEALVESYEGKIVSKNVDLGDSRYGSMTVKIPSKKGNEFVEKLNKDNDVSSYATDVSDVTEQYTDTKQEIQNLQKKIKLYEELARQTSIKEINSRIEITDKIYDLERQIENLKQQNKNIDKNVEYRDVVITLSAPDKIRGERNYWRNIAQMIVLVFQGSLRVLVALIAIAIPFFVLIGLPIIFSQKRKKKQI